MVLLLLLAGGTAAGVRIQHTASLPRGLYRVVRATHPGAIAGRGAIGVWCLADSTARWARDRGYLGVGACPGGVEPVTKVILATRADTVDFDASGVWVSGHRLANTAAPRRDAKGRLLTPVHYGRYVLRADEVWVWSPYTARSFDSRYYGPLRTSALVSIVRPVWTP